DAVGCEPVSAPNSLLTGKLTGNLPISGVSAANLTTSLRACARPDRATWAACRRRRGDRVVFFAAIAHSRYWHNSDFGKCPSRVGKAIRSGHCSGPTHLSRCGRNNPVAKDPRVKGDKNPELGHSPGLSSGHPFTVSPSTESRSQQAEGMYSQTRRSKVRFREQ